MADTATAMPVQKARPVLGAGPIGHSTRASDGDDLVALWRDRRDERARTALVKRFMPLARSLARRYERSSEPFDDLLQVAALGLVKAIDRFDPDRGNAFVSFAVPTILGELRRYFRDSCWDVHVPRGTQERTLKLEEAERRISADQGRPPTVGQLAQYLEIDSEQVLDAMAAAQAYGALSLDAPRPTKTGEAASTYADTLGALDDGYELVDYGVTITRALKHLPPRERLVLKLRFAEDLTQSEIAERIGVSQMQVSRLLRRAVEQVRILARVGESDA